MKNIKQNRVYFKGSVEADIRNRQFNLLIPLFVLFTIVGMILCYLEV